MPRLKYWNPATPMIVNRTSDQAGPATMTIYFRQSAASSSSPVTPEMQPSSSATGQSKAVEPSGDERVVTIDMKGQHSDAILREFVTKTGAVPVSPTPVEEAEMRDIEERTERAVVDREVMRRYLVAERREKALMSQAKTDVAAMKKRAN